jgi:uncharacterized membrane protein YraQ (UPF0718 family)
MAYIHAIWEMATEAAPWLLLGFLAAAAVRAWVPTALITRQLGGRSVRSVAKASVIGIPLPLCSCGVLPAALGLRRQGASRPATVSFLISTPEIGFDSFMLSYALLGPFLAITRPIAALVTSLAAGLSSLLLTDPPDSNADAPEAPKTSSCCSSQPKPSEPTSSCCSSSDEAKVESSCCSSQPEPTESCCGSAKPQAAEAPAGAWARLVEGVRYVFTTLLDDVKWWLAIAIVIAGAAMAFTNGQPDEFLQEWGQGPLAMLVMLVVGVPLYVCATASTPIAAALLVAGVSPGAVIVLLLAGPATNIGSIAILRRELGNATLAVYLAAIAICSMGIGVAVNWLVGHFKVDIAAQAEHAGHVFPHWFATAAAVLLIALAIGPVRRVILRLPRRTTSCCD